MNDEWNDQKYEFLHLSLVLLNLTVETYDMEWMNEWMYEWINGWMNEWMNEQMNERVTWMMNELSFHEISYIFRDFQLERDRPTDQPTNRQS